MTRASNWFGLELDRERVGLSDREGLGFLELDPDQKGLGSLELDGVFCLKPGVACVVDIVVSPGSLTRGGPVGAGPGNVRQTAQSVRCAGTEKTIVVGGSGVSGCR